MQLSIIVPVYNAEKYLSRCVQSILNQTFSDFELILVDDGSPDNCPVLCDEYARQDSRITVVHKTNGGQADARNLGLSIARGEYIGFVDSDDMIHPKMFELLMAMAERTSADIAQCGHKKFSDADAFLNEANLCTDGFPITVLDSKTILKDFFPKYRYLFTSIVCDKIYKRSVFDNVRFPLGVYYEDAAIRLDTLAASQTIAVTDIPLYFYYQHHESTMHAPYSEKTIHSIIYSCMIVLNFFRNRNDPNQTDLALHDFFGSYCRLKLTVLYVHPHLRQKLKEMESSFNKETANLFRNPNLCKMEKAILVALRVCPRLALILCRRFFPEYLPFSFQSSK